MSNSIISIILWDLKEFENVLFFSAGLKSLSSKIIVKSQNFGRVETPLLANFVGFSEKFLGIFVLSEIFMFNHDKGPDKV